MSVLWIEMCCAPRASVSLRRMMIRCKITSSICWSHALFTSFIFYYRMFNKCLLGWMCGVNEAKCQLLCAVSGVVWYLIAYGRARTIQLSTFFTDNISFWHDCHHHISINHIKSDAIKNCIRPFKHFNSTDTHTHTVPFKSIQLKIWNPNWMDSLEDFTFFWHATFKGLHISHSIRQIFCLYKSAPFLPIRCLWITKTLVWLDSCLKSNIFHWITF